MSLFCGASSTVATLPFRAVRPPLSLQTGAQRVTLGGGSPQFSRASSLISLSRGSKLSAITAQENLVSVLESQIESAVVNEETPDDGEEEDKLPEGFPFRIIDTPGERVFFLTRKFENETILVEIDPSAPFDEAKKEEPNDPQAEVLIGISMVINVSKHDYAPCLEFLANAYIDEIVINAIYVRQPQELSDLDENLQKAFHRFLEIRGIKPNITEFVADYLANKDRRERLQLLKDVKTFVDM
ncbi:hypothetical protein IGI04_009990 [Brassica rapa subsp. trilocularis]|uniref:Uncharacterized protein n=1 Tax=Brassica rapa subsp. trilocularis TaxID=1813537 RepID=A0ABQ7N175_BRACM|nr:hypothetical protein IGI04_009990 [Brassica rapa subsp. trilocularis]